MARRIASVTRGLVGAGGQEVESGDDGALELRALPSVHGGGGEGLRALHGASMFHMEMWLQFHQLYFQKTFDWFQKKHAYIYIYIYIYNYVYTYIYIYTYCQRVKFNVVY